MEILKMMLSNLISLALSLIDHRMIFLSLYLKSFSFMFVIISIGLTYTLLLMYGK